MPLMDSANQIFGGPNRPFSFRVPYYASDLLDCVSDHSDAIPQADVAIATESRRTFALSRRTFTASAHARRTDDEMIFRRPVCTSTRAISESRKELSQKNGWRQSKPN